MPKLLPFAILVAVGFGSGCGSNAATPVVTALPTPSRSTASPSATSTPTQELPGPTPTQTPTPTPTPTETASPFTITPADVGRSLEPGTYTVNGFVVPLSVDIPDGWEAQEFSENYFEIRNTHEGDDVLNVVLIAANKVYDDPCHTQAGPKLIGPSVANLVTALSNLPDFQVENLGEVVVGGASGTKLAISNSLETAAAGCSAATLPIGTYDKGGTDTDIAMFGGESDLFWIVDAGGTRIVIALNDAGPGNRQPAEEMVGGISFVDTSAIAPKVPATSSFDQTSAAAWNSVSFSYPSGWTVTRAKQLWFDEASPLEPYDVAGAKERALHRRVAAPTRHAAAVLHGHYGA